MHADRPSAAGPPRGTTSRCAALALACVLGALLAPGVAGAQPTYVSLTFDDGSADQLQAATMLAEHAMNATFYVNSAQVASSSYYMSWNEIDQLAAAGNEIGGHTLHHTDLTTQAPAAQLAEVCDDRQALVARGYDPVSFAYPFAAWSASSRAAVASCGYSSGRGVGNAGCLPGCVAAESVPPADAFVLRTPPGITSTTTLATLQGYVTRAVAAGGGWVILTMHNFCDSGCGENGMRPADLDALLDWLQAQPAGDVAVRTVRQVMAVPPPPQPANLLQNPGLEAGAGPTGASCWLRAQTGTNSATWAHSADSHGGANAETVTIGTYVDGDQKLVSVQDPVVAKPTLGAPATATTGGTLAAGTWFYRLTATSATGETLPSAEVSATTTTATSKVTLTWSAPAGATGYRIYRSSTSGAQTLLAAVGAVTAYADTGAATPGAATPPTSNSASRATSCSPAGTPGHVYRVAAWYQTSAAASVRMVAYYRDLNGAWQFWREQVVPASTTWRAAVWQTPQLPAGATAVGIGFSLRSPGSAAVDDLVLGDLSAPPPGYAAAVAADNPRHRWRLGESGGTAMTPTGPGPAGAYQNGVTLGQPAATGDGDSAAQFNGTSAHAYVNGVAAPQAAYTLEILMKADPPVQAGSLIDHGGAGALYVTPDRFCFRQTATDVCWQHAPAAGVWYHVAGTWDSTSNVARLYVDGVERAAATAPGAPSGSGTLYVGFGGPAPWFAGALDEPAYYATALGADRIAAHYAGCTC
jgi:peptidoglycan/xylan/chitin deacetylase (PgdA/CDA1 family)